MWSICRNNTKQQKEKIKIFQKKSISFVIDICMRNPYSHNKFIKFVIKIYKKTDFLIKIFLDKIFDTFCYRYMYEKSK